MKSPSSIVGLFIGISLLWWVPYANAGPLGARAVCVNVSHANVRAGPGTQHQVMEVLPGGSGDFHDDAPPKPLIVIGETEKWWRIDLPEGDQAWIAKSLTRNAVEVTVEVAIVYDRAGGEQVSTMLKGSLFCTGRPLGRWHRIYDRNFNDAPSIHSNDTSLPVESSWGSPFIAAILNCDDARVLNFIAADQAPALSNEIWRGVVHSAMYWALQVGCFQVADLLVQEAGLDPNLGGLEGSLIYQWSVSRGGEKYLRWLLSRGVDPNDAGWEDETTPLHAAVTYSSLSVVKLLVDAGANLDPDEHPGCITALEIAIEEGRTYIAAFLEMRMREAGIDVTPKHDCRVDDG
jgi:hypothetical protein